MSIPSSTNPGKYDVLAAHFEAQDNPFALWDLIGSLPAGTHVALAGAIESEGGTPGGYSKELAVTAGSVGYLWHKFGVTIDGYFYGNGLWVDNSLNYYAYKKNVELKTWQ